MNAASLLACASLIALTAFTPDDSNTERLQPQLTAPTSREPSAQDARPTLARAEAARPVTRTAPQAVERNTPKDQKTTDARQRTRRELARLRQLESQLSRELGTDQIDWELLEAKDPKYSRNDR